MRIIVAPDSFKGNMSASEACDIIESGILHSDKDAVIYKVPLADGGEGTARSLTLSAKGRFVKTAVHDPFGNIIETQFGLINNGKTAVLDMASASGIELIPREKLNPILASSYGTGELIAAALDSGAAELIIGIGGSATNDGGIGLISALGFKVLDSNGQLVGHGGQALEKIASVDSSAADKRLKNVSIKVACDVTNPMLGPNGASAVFGPQKGATPEMVTMLDAGLAKLADAWIKAGLTDNVSQPGDGAAGGAGAALRICLGAKMESGALLVMKYVGFFDLLGRADLVITGEGMTDSQTAGGKLCCVVAREARKAGLPVALISGALAGDAEALFLNFDIAVSIACGQIGFDAMIKDSRRDLGFAVENLIRAIKLGKRMKNMDDLNSSSNTNFNKDTNSTSSTNFFNDANLSGMSPVEAKEYILNFISTLKLTERQIQNLDDEIAKWKPRVELANSRAQPELAAEAEKEINKLTEKQSVLKNEAEQLKAQIEEMRRQIPILAAKERSIDPDLLEQELLIAAGYLPGDEEKVRQERKFREMEKDAVADAALAELKAKIGKGSEGN